MRQGYRMNFAIEELEARLKHCQPVKRLVIRSETYENFKNDFLGYYLKDGSSNVFDAAKLNDGWFPEINCDVFVSYSHLDVDDAECIADLLYQYFGLSAFVDSFFWKSCDELQKMIDDTYSTVDYDEDIYDYRKVQYSASHVHLLLVGQLLRVIENSDCFLLWGTPNSLINENGEIQSSSPWIYFETLLYDRLIRTERKRLAAFESMNESMRYQISYPICTENIKTVSIEDMIELNMRINNTGREDALNMMHDMLFAKNHDVRH